MSHKSFFYMVIFCKVFIMFDEAKLFIKNFFLLQNVKIKIFYLNYT